MNRILMITLAVSLVCISIANGQTSELPPPPAPPFAQGGESLKGARPPQRQRDAIQGIMESLKNEKPEEYARLKKLQEENREAFLQEVRKLLPRHRMFSEKVVGLERRCMELSKQYHQARTDEEREVLKDDLKKAVEAATDALISDMKERVQMMERHLKEMESGRDEIIQRRMDTLLKKKHDNKRRGMPPMHFDRKKDEKTNVSDEPTDVITVPPTENK